ncbi:putative septin [Suhomyces tanzawaensis NRRL Y-17324]|uniref:Putative septin n=1 Tax=Suhomyces tanzawaensis NRRL Y-17324 TaxID=984487 RepID=A0A1E4SMV4_9ASCO|nr:putative septin [Suhomyces tanzawaensis NRRL Y-17324]ODV80864.1 putative septin [Suhomyces tanzawaensis NRRL Y-17324]
MTTYLAEVETPIAATSIKDNIQQEVKIIKRKLNGYVGFANLPKQWHRKSIRRGFSLNIMAVGEAGLGKATLINTLFNREILKKEVEVEEEQESSETVSVKIKNTTAEIDEDGVKLKLNVITAPGFGESVNNVNSWKIIVDEINSRFDSFLEAESRINRSTVNDERVHAFLYFIEPTGHSLRALDITLMKQVHEKVNLIPVIAKSDTLTGEEIAEFKQRILEDIKYQGIKTFQPLDFENDEEETVLNTKQILSKFPFAVVGSTKEVETPDGRIVRGRSYPWGVIEVDNEDHNDFIKLRQLLVRNFLEELKEHTANTLYENYRTEKLNRMGIAQDNTVFREFDPLAKQEEERALHEAKLAKMEAEMKAVFQQKVSEKEKKLQRSEADLFSRHKEMKDKLTKQIKLLEDKKVQLEKQKTLPQEPAASSPAPTKTRKGFLR